MGWDLPVRCRRRGPRRGGERWKWLRDIDVNDAPFPARRKGSVSIRVFSDGGFTLHSREDFDIAPASKKWWED